MKHATLTILLITLTAALALGAGNNWRNERPITGVSGTNYVTKSAIASDGDRAVCVFTRGTSGVSPVKWIKSTNGGVTWNSEAQLPQSAEIAWSYGNNAYRPIAVALNGQTIEVVWAGPINSGTYRLYYQRSADFGVNWLADAIEVAPAPDAQSAYNSVSIVTLDGYSNIVWTHEDYDVSFDYTYIKHRRRNPDGTWENTQTLYSYYLVYAPLHVDIDQRKDTEGTKKACVVWNEPTSVSDDIRYKTTSDYGSNWDAGGIVEATNGASRFPSVALQSDLDVMVVWEDNTDSSWKIFCRKIGGNTHSTVPGGEHSARVVVDETDSVVVAMDHEISSEYLVYCNESVDGYTWIHANGDRVQYNDDSPNANYRLPDVAPTHTDGTMRLHIWNGYHTTYSHQELWVNVNDLGKPAAPTDLEAVKFCSDLIMSYVRISYTATTALDDSGYNIYRAAPNCLGTFSKLNGDIVTGTTYYDFDVPQGTSECDPYCACYKARAVDLALNEGGDSNTSEVGACDSRAMQPAILIAAVQLGQASPSPYTQRRAGYLSWGTGKKADVDPERLEYTIRGLDPKAWYVLDFGYYAPDEGRVAAARAGDVVLHGPKSIPQEQICVPFLLPKKVYANGTLTFAIERVDGPNAMLGKFRLWKMPDKFHGGPQSAGEAARSMVQPYLAPPRPNPSTGEVFLGYWLPKEGETTLRIYNTAGQMVREIDSGTKNAGAHHLVWDGKNVSGRKAPNGVYLVRLASGSVSATQRITILR